MFSRHTIWCVFMFTALAVTAVVAIPALDASDGEDGRSTNEGGNREGTEIYGEPSSDQDGYECRNSNNSCPDPNSVCVNTKRSYMCICKHGYFKLEEEFCKDIDECCATDNMCLDPRTQCVNTDGSYTCDCKEGYTKHEGGFCHDIDECRASNDSCPDPHSTCVNTEGSYICLCREGYNKVEGTCHDIHECCTADNVCPDPRTECVNTDGSYTCDCKEGYIKHKEGFCYELYTSNCAQLPNQPPRVVIPHKAGQDVLCDTATDGGGWIVFQRRVNGAVDFYRNWTAYKEGFGDLDTDFWLGNEILHLLTSKRQHELRIDMTFKGKSYFAQYDTFSIESEEKKYTLRLGAFSSRSNTTDNLSRHNGQAFSTFDRDNDSHGSLHCAVQFHGAWWYDNCHSSNLNGHWGDKTPYVGPHWYGLTGHTDVVTFSEMKIRPIV